MKLNVRTVVVAFLALMAGVAHAEEFAASKVTLYKNFPPSEFGAQSGNTVWGYVSPSGREYALMGFNTNMAVFEVTDPNNVKHIGSIPHKPGLWADIKVYKHAAYVVTETANTGIQVVDLSRVDEGEVKLVKTVMSPGRSHTIAVDEVSGYLYTCGSREGTGTTMAFDLKKDPLDPVQVGMKTLTPVYQHEAQVVTYTEGPYKGRQIFFGGGEGRGLEIWDVTDKDDSKLVRRVAYPFVGYCHQGWLSSDKKYFYVNDEFDETTSNLATRTLVFDVSVLENAELVATYTTGKPAVDHNLYLRNDFVFHANYTTGLWIYDANEDPLRPQLRGFFDTHPESDSAQFEGAWSNYPFLPSGTMLISDINRGLFVVNTMAATRTPVPFKAFKATAGKATGGKDDQPIQVSGNKVALEFDGVGKWKEPSRVGFSFVPKLTKGSATTTVELYDYTKKAWVAAAQQDDGDFRPEGRDIARFLEPGTMAMRVRVTMTSSTPLQGELDQPSFVLNP